MYSWWPRNSLRKAYVSWQALESRRLAAHQELERRYLEVHRLAESIDAEASQGLLRAVRLALDRPLEPPALTAHHHLQKAFAILGKSLCRRAPAALLTEIRRYAFHIDEVCRKYDEMGARLRSAQKLLGLLSRDPEFGNTQNFRLALISPEAAWLVFHLRQKRLARRQAKEHGLAGGWRTRMATCQRWLGLLQDAMPSSTFGQLQRSFKDLAAKAARKETPDVPTLLADHAKLDLVIAVANRHATRAIAGLLRQKAN